MREVGPRLKVHKSKLFQSKITQNAASLYAVHACRKLVPIFTIPYLARVLGPSGWGAVTFTLSIGEFIGIFVEFGFQLSATRNLAQNRESEEACERIVTGTIVAQAVLALIGVAVALIVSTQIPLLRSRPQLLWAGLIYGVAQGMAPIWLFQGLERMALAAFLEVVSKLSVCVAIFLLVHTVADEWRVLALQAVSPVVTASVGIWLAHRWFNLRRPTVDSVWNALRAGWSMFLLRSGVAMYSTGNVLILGFFAPVNVLGFYASAEKVSKAITGLLLPIRDAFYPRLSRLAPRSPKENQQMTRLSAIIEIACGLLLSIGTWVFSGFIIRVLYGNAFGEAAAILRILAVVPFIYSISDAIGFQSLLPIGKESLATKAILVGGALNVVMAALLAPKFAGRGMAMSVGVTELAVCIVLVATVMRTTGIFRKRMQPEAANLAPVLATQTRASK